MSQMSFFYSLQVTLVQNPNYFLFIFNHKFNHNTKCFINVASDISALLCIYVFHYVTVYSTEGLAQVKATAWAESYVRFFPQLSEKINPILFNRI